MYACTLNSCKFYNTTMSDKKCGQQIIWHSSGTEAERTVVMWWSAMVKLLNMTGSWLQWNHSTQNETQSRTWLLVSRHHIMGTVKWYSMKSHWQERRSKSNWRQLYQETQQQLSTASPCSPLSTEFYNPGGNWAPWQPVCPCQLQTVTNTAAMFHANLRYTVPAYTVAANHGQINFANWLSEGSEAMWLVDYMLDLLHFQSVKMKQSTQRRFFSHIHKSSENTQHTDWLTD